MYRAYIAPLCCPSHVEFNLEKKQMPLCHTNRKSLKGTFSNIQQKQHHQKMEKYIIGNRRDEPSYIAYNISMLKLETEYLKENAHTAVIFIRKKQSDQMWIFYDLKQDNLQY